MSKTVNGTNVVESKPLVSASLVDLVGQIGKAIPEGKRVYRVTVKEFDGEEYSSYVLTNSPGNAALTVCEVSTVSQRELTTAAFEALNQAKSPS